MPPEPSRPQRKLPPPWYLLGTLLCALTVAALGRADETVRTVVQQGFDSGEKPSIFHVGPEAQTALLGTKSVLIHYDLRSRLILDRMLNAWPTFFTDAAIDPTGRFGVIVRGTAPAYEAEVSLRNLDSGQEIPLEGTPVAASDLLPGDGRMFQYDGKQVVVIDPSTGGRTPLPVRTDVVAEAGPLLPASLPDGLLLSWDAPSHLTVRDSSGKGISFPIVPDPDASVMEATELHFALDGHPRMFGVDRKRMLVTDAATDEVLADFLFPEGEERARSNSGEDDLPAFIVDGSAARVLVHDGRGTLLVIAAEGGEVLLETPGGKPFAFSKDGNTLACWDASIPGVSVHRVGKGRISAIKRDADPLNTGGMALTATGDRLAIAGGRSDVADGLIFDTGTGRVLMRLPEVNGPMAFDSAGKRLAFNRFRGRYYADVLVADLRTGGILQTPEQVFIRGFSPDNLTWDSSAARLLIANGGDGLISVPVAKEGIKQETTLLAGAFEGNVTAQDRFLTTTSRDGRQVVIDAASGAELARVALLTSGRTVSVTSAGRYLGTPGALAAIAFRRGLRAYPTEQFDLEQNRPHEVLGLFGLPEGVTAPLAEVWRKRLRRHGLDERRIDSGFQIPEITLVNRRDIPLTTPARELRFQVEIVDRHARPIWLHAHANGVPVATIALEAVPDQPIAKELNLNLSVGRNQIDLFIENENGAQSLRETAILDCTAPSETLPKLFLVAVGVSDYADDRLDLELAAKDAGDFCAAVEKRRKGEFSEIKTIRLLDKAATRESILATKSLLASGTADDEVIVFIAGHGFQDGDRNYWYGTTDIDPDNPGTRGLGYDDLEGLFNGIPQRKRLLLMDTCFAGEADPEDVAVAGLPGAVARGVVIIASVFSRVIASERASGETIPTGLMDRYFSDLRRRTGANVLTASGGVEFVFAEEIAEIGNGVFTHCLLEALHDEAHSLRVSDLLKFVSGRVPALTDGRQKPTGRELNRLNDPFFTSVPGGSTPVPGSPDAPPGGLVSGAWHFEEQVNPAHGGYHIEWDCALYQTGTAEWTVVGRKSRINGNLPTPGEKQAVSILRLRGAPDGSLEGIGVESGGRGAQIASTLAGTLGPDGLTLSLSLSENGQPVSRLSARLIRADSPDRKPLRPGRWSIREIVLPAQGGWDISWDYQIRLSNDGLSAEGRKIRVNGKDPTKGEKATVSLLSLDRPAGLSPLLQGVGRERNVRGDIISTSLIGAAASDGGSLFLETRENGHPSSYLVGRLVDP